MLPEENKDIGSSTITEESTSQEQVPQSQYGYEILGRSDRFNSGGGPGSGVQRREGPSEGMNGAGLEFADEGLPTTPTTISEGPGPSILGNGRVEHGDVPPRGGPEMPTGRRDRVSEYEEFCRRNPLAGGKGKGKRKGGGLGLERDVEVVEFRVKKSVWVGSPVTRFPNGEYSQTPAGCCCAG